MNCTVVGLFGSAVLIVYISFFFFNDTATTEIYTLSLHDALPILSGSISCNSCSRLPSSSCWIRSEEHTSELQSRLHLVCRLLLEKQNDIHELRHALVQAHVEESVLDRNDRV